MGLHYLLRTSTSRPSMLRRGGSRWAAWSAAGRALDRRPPGAARVTMPGDDGVRRERPRTSEPRPLSQPWLHEAVGTGEWTGRRSPRCCEEAGLDERCDRGVFTRRRSRRRGRRGAGLRAEPPIDEPPRRRAPRVRDERAAVAAAARLSGAAARAGLVRHDQREVARRITVRRRAVRRATRCGPTLRQHEEDDGRR